ncbi:MAG: hypothetical protein R2731_05810 [Nocardioides sp.]
MLAGRPDSPNELAFYDAMRTNEESARLAMEDETLRAIYMS